LEPKRPILTTVPESDSTEDVVSGSKKDIASSFLRLATLSTQPHSRLGRYEQMLWRQTRQLVTMLETLRRHKPQPSRKTFPYSFR